MSGVLDAYLGEVPTEFTYNGKMYTPQSFATNVVKVDPNEYIEFISGTDVPYYSQSLLKVPDNWAMHPAWNVPLKIYDHCGQRLARRIHRGMGWGCERTHLQLEERWPSPR
ncbi:MAG: hypothetical protein R2818_12360 [Flavobacteriales bacterium]